MTILAVFATGFVAVGVYRLWGGQGPAAVDTRPAYQAAAVYGAFPIASPAPLPADWRALSSDFSTEAAGAILRIRLRAPSGGVAQLIESAWEPATLLAVELGDHPRDQGGTTIEGRPWQRYAAAGGLRALVLAEAGRTVVIVGTARERELRDLATSL
jgi:hypothetical protein